MACFKFNGKTSSMRNVSHKTLPYFCCSSYVNVALTDILQGQPPPPPHPPTPIEWVEFGGNGLSWAQVRTLTNVDDLLATSVTSLTNFHFLRLTHGLMC